MEQVAASASAACQERYLCVKQIVQLSNNLALLDLSYEMIDPASFNRKCESMEVINMGISVPGQDALGNRLMVSTLRGTSGRPHSFHATLVCVQRSRN